MGFLDKAKAALQDLDVDKAKAAFKELDFGGDKPKSDDTAAPSVASTSTSTAAPTPASSIAPKEKSSVKLPLAIRKEVRDNWENKIPALEASLTQILGQPWTIDIDVGLMYLAGQDTEAMAKRAKERPGEVLNNYIEDTIANIKTYINKFGADGKQELNTVASNHSITMGESTDPNITVAGCDIHDGSLRILYGKGRFSYNIRQATDLDHLPKAITAAGQSSAGLDFEARTSVKNFYDPKVDAVKAKLETILATNGLVLNPNFESNYAKLSCFPNQKELTRDWKKGFGSQTLMYFESLAKSLEFEGFAKDDMLQEGLADVMEKKEISFEIVDKLQKGTYHETLPENGVLYIRTIPKYYNTNIGQTGQGLVKLL